MEFKKGDIYGTHRVIEPKGVLPQPADIVDNNMEIYDNEVLIDVHLSLIHIAAGPEAIMALMFPLIRGVRAFTADSWSKPHEESISAAASAKAIM